MASLEDYEMAVATINSLKEVIACLKQERDVRSRPWLSSACYLLYKSYSRKEIKSATRSFSEKVGEGSYGAVYKGDIEGTAVAVMDASSSDEKEFLAQMELLRNIIHPHLVRVVGNCLKERCIVYEYMGNGSLADYLPRKNNTSPLLWHHRVRIASEVCSALHYLHSLKPNGILLCSLKPENILLDEFYTSKISDMHMTRPLPRNLLLQDYGSYIDPCYLRDIEFTDKSDVYSLGIIILQLLTGKEAQGLVKEFKKPLAPEQLDDLLDTLAEWPIDQAFKLASLALECTEIDPQKRPVLHPTLTEALDKLQVIASRIVQPAQEREVPSFFTCSISHEIMDDPHVTADGISYELREIKEWFARGKRTSPKTNKPLDNTNLFPNSYLRAAIQEWKEAK